MKPESVLLLDFFQGDADKAHSTIIHNLMEIAAEFAFDDVVAPFANSAHKAYELYLKRQSAFYVPNKAAEEAENRKLDFDMPVGDEEQYQLAKKCFTGDEIIKLRARMYSLVIPDKGDWTIGQKLVREAFRFETCYKIYDDAYDIYGSVTDPTLIADCWDRMNACITKAEESGHPIDKKEVQKPADDDDLDPVDQYCLGMELKRNSSIQSAVKCFEYAAERGIREAMLQLFAIYREGMGDVPKDENKAARYYFMSGEGRN